MVRLNGRIALRRNSDENENGGSGGGGIRLFPRKVNFFGLLGATMLALKLKEHWDGYRKVPTEPPAGATNNNGPAPPPYRDDDCDTESAIGLDTTINMPTRTRRKRSCCVCCGLNCGLFCKALGVVILISVIWNGIKFAKWMLTPSPTGLENMPEFSTSLGCLDATHFWQDNKDDGTFYTIPLGPDASHDLVIDGGAVGTITFAPSPDADANDDDSIKVSTTVRTNDAGALQAVQVHTPNFSPLPESSAPGTSYFSLMTPVYAKDQNADVCMRYDLTVYLPSNLRTLRLDARSVAQVEFVDFDVGAGARELSEVKLTLSSVAAANLVLPSADLVANNVDISMRGGYLVGTLGIANSTSIKTNMGDAITKLDVFTSDYQLPSESSSDDSATAHLDTVTGKGRTDITYSNPSSRPIRSSHTVKPRLGLGTDTELRLTYKGTGFNGKVDVDARSSTMWNVQSTKFGSGSGSPGEIGGSREHWVGDKDGGDYLKVVTPGWVGIYF